MTHTSAATYQPTSFAIITPLIANEEERKGPPMKINKKSIISSISILAMSLSAPHAMAQDGQEWHCERSGDGENGPSYDCVQRPKQQTVGFY